MVVTVPLFDAIIRISPADATSMLIARTGPIGSLSEVALRRMVKNALNCRTREDSPGDMPLNTARFTTHQRPTPKRTPYAAMAQADLGLLDEEDERKRG